MILILTNKLDVTADFVVRELRNRKAQYFRLNTEDLVSEQCNISYFPLSIKVTKNGREFDLAKETKVVWNRRPGKPFDNLSTQMKPSKATVKFINNQWYSWLEVLQLIQNVVWFNHPHSNDKMESKILQLFLAQKIGFSIPDTLISNDIREIEKFFHLHKKRIIAKALYSPLIEEKNQDYFIFSNIIEELPSNNNEEFKISPSIFQQALIPKVDYRVTVIQNKALSVKITDKNHDGVPVDWRTIKDGISFQPIDLPNRIESLCINFVSECGLKFGAIDLIEHEDKFYFIEINPNGEWGWLQKPHGLPIAETICDAMLLNIF
jgi:glutathione synthase/RimK-type ligase-like ATP-grasp enzyme